MYCHVAQHCPSQSLVLLEYLVKNGSERVVDDARSHVSMIKMMKNFHYVDEKGKDQGLNGKSLVYELYMKPAALAHCSNLLLYSS